jgi:hypothetical protein
MRNGTLAVLLTRLGSKAVNSKTTSNETYQLLGFAGKTFHPHIPVEVQALIFWPPFETHCGAESVF